MLTLRLVYQLINKIKIPTQCCEIDYFAVSKGFNSVGIGKKLVKISEKIAKKKKKLKKFLLKLIIRNWHFTTLIKKRLFY